MAGTPTAAEVATAARWCAASFGNRTEGSLPISFRYGGRESGSFLQGWAAERLPAPADETATRQRLTFTDPQTGLQCRYEVTLFADFPAVDWVASFQNTGDADTPILADIQPLDAVFSVPKEQTCRLHHARGSSSQVDDFAPLETLLGTPSNLRLAPVGGRSSNGTLPFFNLELGDHGIIGAIGWSGGWTAGFDRQADGAIRVRAGMERTHLTLRPGEEIRTPRVLLLFWEGDRLHGHHLLRQFILAHHTPRPNGRLLQAPVCDSNWGDRMDHDQIAKARWLKAQQIPVEYFWIDAGWYGDAHKEGSDTFGPEWAQQVGNWHPNAITYPQGLQPVGAALKELGFGFVLWVEPERVFAGTRYTREHPEWLLGPVGNNYLFDLGIPEARRHMTEVLSTLIAESGVTCLRQDFNTNPAPFWQAADAANRVGMHEIRHITGLYAMWDELLARHPGLIIDNCASGGRRIDLETISRSIPLWRSDVQCYPGFALTAMQNQTHGLSLWVPLSTGCATEPTTYAFRSALGPGMVTGGWAERGANGAVPVDWWRTMLAELQQVRRYFYGDFYPLLSFSLADDTWAAWQFDRPDLGEGMVLALRRPNSPFPRLEAPLHGLDAGALYAVQWLDTGVTKHVPGRTLRETGIALDIAGKQGSALITYKRVETA